MAGLIWLWNQGSFMWSGPVRERTAFIEAEYRVVKI